MGTFSCPAEAGQDAGNGGWAGGIDNSGTLTITNSTISNNNAGRGDDRSTGASGTGSDVGAGQAVGSGGVGG